MVKKKAVVIIGAGVVGLAIARKLAESGKQVLVLEANKQVGLEASVQNSAVIHAGIYYSKDSLKAKFCVEGQKMLYDYCDRRHVNYKKIGKLIVATSENQLGTLQDLETNAKRNGVSDIETLTATDVKAIEPNVSCHVALFSPSTGIINLEELIKSLKTDVENFGGEIMVNSPVISGEVLSTGFRLLVGDQRQVIESDYLINIAGVWAPKVSRTIDGIPDFSIPKEYYTKGSYFKYKKKPPFSRLIYPVPERDGLGIHATIDIFNQVRFGPDVEWVNDLDYSIATDKKQNFSNAIQAYFPQISEDDIEPEFAGIRPKIKPKEEQPQDFVIQTSRDHHVEGFIALYGIESPGLTASLAIANQIKSLV